MTRRRHGPRELDRAAGTPLWQQLRDDLVARLEGGEFPDRFPGELELVEIYAVSRHTVREALRHLRQQGLIESSRGRSSVANPGLIHQQLGTIYSLFHVLESRGLRQTSELLVADSRVGPEAAVRLGLPEDSTLVYLERVRYGDDEPIAWDRAWLDPELGAPMLDADLSHTALYDEWARTAGVRLTGGREEDPRRHPQPRGAGAAADGRRRGRHAGGAHRSAGRARGGVPGHGHPWLQVLLHRRVDPGQALLGRRQRLSLAPRRVRGRSAHRPAPSRGRGAGVAGE